MKYCDLHLKENQELHSCFLSLGIGTGVLGDEAVAGSKCCRYKSVLTVCPGFWLASFPTLILSLLGL